MMLLQLKTVQRDMCYMRLLLKSNTDQRCRVCIFLLLQVKMCPPHSQLVQLQDLSNFFQQDIIHFHHQLMNNIQRDYSCT